MLFLQIVCLINGHIINSQNQMIKLVHGSKNKIVKLDKPNFNNLRTLIKQSFPDVPVDYTLSYLDADKDEISLGSDEDLIILLNSGAKINKIYIKQSLSQSIEITDRIEPSFQIYDSSLIKVEPEEKPIETNHIFQKNENKVEEVILVEQSFEEQKSLQVQLPIYKPIEDKAEKLVVLPEEKEQKQEAILIEKSSLLAQFEEAQLALEAPEAPKVQVQQRRYEESIQQPKQEEAPEKVEKNEKPDSDVLNNSKIISVAVSDTVKIQLEPSAFREIVKQIMKEEEEKKLLQEKKLVQEKPAEQQKPCVQKKKIEKRQVIDVDAENFKPSRARIFDQKKSDKKPRAQPELIYHGVICCNCKDEYGIIGIRYQCIYCEGFNICETCQDSIEHEHSLLKVKQPSQCFKKDQLIERFRKEINSKAIPHGHYVPSISKQQANRFMDTSKAMIKESMDRAQRMIGDMFLKLEMSHSNPYELHKPQKPAKVETMREKIDHLMDMFGIEERQAKYLCEIYKTYSKEQLANVYIQKKTNRL